MSRGPELTARRGSYLLRSVSVAGLVEFTGEGF